MEVITAEGRRPHQVEDIRLDIWSNGLHDVECHRVAVALVRVEDADPWIETDCETGDAGFPFEECVEVVEDGVGRVGGPS